MTHHSKLWTHSLTHYLDDHCYDWSISIPLWHQPALKTSYSYGNQDLNPSWGVLKLDNALIRSIFTPLCRQPLLKTFHSNGNQDLHHLIIWSTQWLCSFGITLVSQNEVCCKPSLMYSLLVWKIWLIALDHLLKTGSL